MESICKEILNKNSNITPSESSKNKIVSDYHKEYLHDFSNVLDHRISEINDQLQESKRNLLELFEEDFSNQTLLQVNLKDLHYSIFNQDEQFGLESILKLKKLKENLDNYLSKVDNYFDIKEKFAKSKLIDIIKIQNNKFEFLKYKIGTSKKSYSNFMWSPSQYKTNFTLSDDKKSINIKYQSCYELYVSETVFETGVNCIKMEVDCLSTTSYHSIGIINENYSFGVSCVCLKSQNCFMFDRSGNVFCNNVNTLSSISFGDGQIHEFEIEINLIDETDKFMKIKFNEVDFGPYKITGKIFKLAVGMCNGGNVIYKILH